MDEEIIVDLNLIKKQFLCCTPINKFQWNIISENRARKFTGLDLDIQKKILDETVNDELVKNYPVKKSYQRAFLKLLINELEKISQEIHDELYAAYCSLVSSDEERSSNQYRHFMYEKSPSTRDVITLQESVSFVSQGTTGLCTWQAGLRLAEWCLINRESLASKKILELGCGVGLTGLVVVRTCAPREYIFSDSHPAVLAMLGKNIAANCSSMNNDPALSNESVESEVDYKGVKIQVARLPWEEINGEDTERACRLLDPDIVLAADVLYDESSFESLTGALSYLLKKNKSYAIVAYTVRNEDTIARFTQTLGSCELVFQRIPTPEGTVFIHADETPVRMMKIIAAKDCEEEELEN